MMTPDQIMQAEIPEGKNESALVILQREIGVLIGAIKADKYIAEDINDLCASFTLLYNHALHDNGQAVLVPIDKLKAMLAELRGCRPLGDPSFVIEQTRMETNTATLAKVNQIVEDMKRDYGTPSLHYTWDERTLHELTRRLKELEAKP